MTRRSSAFLAVQLATLAAGAAPATAASAAVAPGRVAFSIASNVPVSNVDAGGAGAAIALPEGGALMLAADGPRVAAIRMRADGSLEPSFGNGGIARITVPGSFFWAKQILRQPDGRLVLVGSGRSASRFELPRFLLARLTANGALDPSFGTGGFAAPDLQAGGAALAPDGSIVLTGNTGRVSPEIATNPQAPNTFRWVVQRLTPAGNVDPAFGSVALGGQTSSAVVVRPDGRIVALGSDRNVSRLAGLTASGAPDPTFNGGLPLDVPVDNGQALLLRTGGAIDVAGFTRIARVTPAGVPDPGFGAGGAVDLGQRLAGAPALLPAPGGGTTVQWTTYEAASAGVPRLYVQHISAAGALGPRAGISPAFGGGLAASRLGVEQNSFRGKLVQRPDGSHLAVGAVSVVRYTGEGEGFSAGLVAVAALSPSFAPDTSFGGPRQPASARVRVPRQRARSDVSLDRVLVRVTASGPGLVQLRVRDGRRRTLAQAVEPVFAAGTTSLRVRLTATGRRLLRGARNKRVLVGHDFRDVLTGRDRGVVAARLR